MALKSLILIALGGVFALGLEARAADVDYKAEEYGYDYCLELARDEANANIGMIYLHPQLLQGDPAGLEEKQAYKQQKHLAQREQRKEKCI
jgi:hypothetical protein